MIIHNRTKGHVLGVEVRPADSFGTRLLGLMFRRSLGPGEGLLIEPCKAIHTHFMRFPIDVLFLDGLGQVLHVIPAMAPWRHSPYIKGANSVLELPAGAAGETEVGDQLEFL
ncbi:MAG: DUF192 domain-containing protein [Mycobacterium leprae]